MKLFQTTLALVLALTAGVSAVPVVETRQSCPYDDFYLCVGPRRSTCLGSGLEICGPSEGGPSPECDKFCKEQAEGECRDLGC